MDRTIAFLLPLPGSPRAVVLTDYGLRRAELAIRGATALATESELDLQQGIRAHVPELGLLELRAADGELALTLDGRPALREDLAARPVVDAAWRHAWIALAGSLLGFLASSLYLERARAFGDPWALKMALHMAGWHLLLAVTLFPASVLGRGTGIRGVQSVSALFFAIHLGIACANLNVDPVRSDGPWIAMLNAASGIAFLAAVLYGQIAYRDAERAR